MINFGIDLGTTNSAIAAFDKGDVIIYKHPTTQTPTLPSVVAIREGQVFVGEKAKEYIMQAPLEVASSFKRKMGTTSALRLGNHTLSPVELSAHVLRELKQFIVGQPVPRAVVITIPASFDTIQSNATKEAGYAAGFEQVELLQEPIAASLAYANQEGDRLSLEGKWLVYDLGGGTFDVALVSVQDGEMRVLDHEGDNFLGGADFDLAIVEQLILPYLESQGAFQNLQTEMRTASGRYNHLYQTLLLKAEQAKLELSTHETAEVEFTTKDDEGETIHAFLTITKAQFESLITPFLDRTLELIIRVLERNKLAPADLSAVVLVGGATYTPALRHTLAERLGIPIHTQIDPTTAVVVGAAYYAGTRKLQTQAAEPSAQAESSLSVKMAFQKASQEEKEYFAARVSGDTTGLSYRITRQDGGFDSGLKQLNAKISEFLPLLADSYNLFEFKVFDADQNLIPLDTPEIGIVQGKFSVVGQPLPQDICLEIDDLENQTTVLEVVFDKNSILPLKKTLVKQVTRTIRKGADEKLTISIVEGPGTALPAANQTIGFISIEGKELSRDLIRGSDIEITLELSESRDLKVNAYVLMTDQEYEQLFVPSNREVHVSRLADQMLGLAQKVRREIAEAEAEGLYENAQELVDLEFDILGLVDQVNDMAEDDVSDLRFQLEDKKRRIAQKIDEQFRDKLIIKVKNTYFETKRELETVMKTYEPTPEDQQVYEQLMTQEKITLATNSTLKIQEYIQQFQRLNLKVRWRSNQYVQYFFLSLANGGFGEFTQPEMAQGLITEGYQMIDQQNFDRLRVLINRLADLLPPTRRPGVGPGGTGIG